MKIKKFRAVCIDCDNKNKQHETQIYVNWEKEYYMIMCYECGKMEAFDKYGENISPEENGSTN